MLSLLLSGAPSLRPAEHMGTTRQPGAAMPAHAARSPGHPQGPLRAPAPEPDTAAHGSEERREPWPPPTGPGVVELHEDYPAHCSEAGPRPAGRTAP